MRALHRPTSALTFLLCTAGWVAHAPAARAQEPPPRPAEAPSDEGLDLRRLLTYADGTIERVRSRLVDGRWEVRRGRDWLAPEQEIVRHRLLSDAQREAATLARDLRRDDHVRRAELARWMAGQGLYDEAIVELNRVLRAAPEHRSALRVLREARIPLALSEDAARDPAVSLKETLIAGAGGTPAVTELAVQHLARFGGQVALPEVLALELRRPQNSRRAFAARALRRLYPGDARVALTHRALLDGWSEVREEAALALGATDDLAVALPALEALGHAHSAVRANAAEALGHMGFEAAVEPLVGHLMHHAGIAAGGGPATGTRANLFAGLQTAYVMDYDLELAQGASIADPIVEVQVSGVVFDVRTAVQLNEVIELRRTMRSLRQLTGQDLKNDPARWARWWEQNQGQWRAVDRARAFEQRKLAAARARGED